MIEKGATTIWELWNGDTADPAMNSGNHVMLIGDLLTWMYEYLGGIRPSREAPAFEAFQIRPYPTCDLTYVKVVHWNPRGRIRSEWQIDGSTFELRLLVPVNTRAEVHVPVGDPSSVTEGGRSASESPGVRFLRIEDGRAVFEVGSGRYQFVAAGYKRT
jgi:alpha-L-rhamnosidase